MEETKREGRRATGVTLVDRMGIVEVTERKLFHPKSISRGYCQEAAYLIHMYSQLPANFVVWFLEIPIKLREELVASTVLGKNPSFLVPFRSWT